MKSSLPSPTKEESRRMLILKRDIGCLPCLRLGFGVVPAHAHHLLSGGKRISHLHTIPLCSVHHTGDEGIHYRKKRFREWFGTDEELLAETNRLVAEFEANTIGGGG